MMYGGAQSSDIYKGGYKRGGEGGVAMTESLFAPGKRRRLNMVGICASIFLPWFVFTTIYTAMCFTIHFQRPIVAKAFVAVGLLMSASAFVIAYKQQQRQFDPMWFTFASLAFFTGTILAAVFGDMNYMYNMQPYYEMQSMAIYPNVNPVTDRGASMMDTGMAYFVDGAAIDMKKSIGFKNDHLYCVAPMSYGVNQLTTYDFWIVGVDCCSGVGGDFRCGEYDNPHARTGLRYMNAEQTPHFKLAVGMAESAYNIKSIHPLFFQFVQDPLAELNTYQDLGFKYWSCGIASYFVVNAVAVAYATYAFSKVGMYYN